MSKFSDDSIKGLRYLDSLNFVYEVTPNCAANIEFVSIYMQAMENFLSNANEDSPLTSDLSTAHRHYLDYKHLSKDIQLKFLVIRSPNRGTITYWLSIFVQ